MSEQQLQAKIIKLLKAQGYYVLKTIVSNRSGIPDIVACSPLGKFVAIEVKAPGKLNTVSPLQAHNLEQIQKSNGISFSTDNLDTVIKKLGIIA